MFQPLPFPCDAATNSLAGATGSRGGKKQENTKTRQKNEERERERERERPTTQIKERLS
jgi:hypothetical protein